MGKVQLARIIDSDMDRVVPTCLRYRRGQADAAAQTLRRAYRVKRPQAVVPALEAKGTSQVRDGSESGLAVPPGA